jgi:hypothetical protein
MTLRYQGTSFIDAGPMDIVRPRAMSEDKTLLPVEDGHPLRERLARAMERRPAKVRSVAERFCAVRGLRPFTGAAAPAPRPRDPKKTMA